MPPRAPSYKCSSPTNLHSRRDLLKLAALGGTIATAAPARAAVEDHFVVNDIHAQLNATRVHAIRKPTSVEDVRGIVIEANRTSRPISIAGGRHAMGGQQFGDDSVLLDTTAMGRVLRFDRERGLIEVEAGIQWPELIAYLRTKQTSAANAWTIIQKQTGADRMCLGGALSSNIHGRGLRLKPFVNDVEAFRLVNAEGKLLNCSRRENSELFRLAIGGYGLFGVIASVTLRLTQRRKLERIVKLIEADELLGLIDRRIADGFRYGDFQYSTDANSDGFLRTGILSCYRPVPDETPLVEGQKELSEDNWRRLIHLAHVDRRRAFDEYTRHYLATDGQIYWSDMQYLSRYIDNYHEAVSAEMHEGHKSTEMITEIYVPRTSFVKFLDEARQYSISNRVELIYGTVRFIQKDDETFLAWAKEPFVCVIFNLHVAHTPQGIARAQRDFRALIDRAIAHRGSYYLTYHRWATRPQVEACYPQFADFLRAKLKYDPAERFVSQWYRHYRRMFSDVLRTAAQAQPAR